MSDLHVLCIGHFSRNGSFVDIETLPGSQVVRPKIQNSLDERRIRRTLAKHLTGLASAGRFEYCAPGYLVWKGAGVDPAIQRLAAALASEAGCDVVDRNMRVLPAVELAEWRNETGMDGGGVGTF